MKFVYPGGLPKALTFSYDDGREYDRKLVDILNQHGMKGSFHLNSGKFDKDGYVTAAEIKTLYAGHEISCHGVEHHMPTLLNDQQMNLEIGQDRIALELLGGTLVQGMSYAYGGYSEQVKSVIRMNGIKYARTTKATKGFWLPTDFLEWHPTCHHNDMLALADGFINTPGYRDLTLFYVWGHSYEFGIPDDWQAIEKFADMMAHRLDTWYATNLEICEYTLAMRAQEYSADGHIIKNPTAKTVWFVHNDELTELHPGQQKEL